MIRNILPAFLILVFTLGAHAQETKLSIGTKGSELAFSKTKLSAKAGVVEITFTNQSDADASMPHNFVLIKPGAKIDELAAAGITAGASKKFLPNSPDIIKATNMLNAGQTDTISVDLKPGAYPYFCSFPGHASMMKGVLTVK